jgi:hypothetical protein
MNCHPNLNENATVHSECFDCVQNSGVPYRGFLPFLGMSSNDVQPVVPAGFAMVPIDSLNGRQPVSAGGRGDVVCFRCGGNHYVSSCNMPDQRSAAEKELAARKKLEKMNESGSGWTKVKGPKGSKYSKKQPKRGRKFEADRKKKQKLKSDGGKKRRYVSSSDSSESTDSDSTTVSETSSSEEETLKPRNKKKERDAAAKRKKRAKHEALAVQEALGNESSVIAALKAKQAETDLLLAQLQQKEADRAAFEEAESDSAEETNSTSISVPLPASAIASLKGDIVYHRDSDGSVSISHQAFLM